MSKISKARKIAVIPARGGSKSVPRKNLALLSNIPLIAYSIHAAKKSNLVDEIVVSTDDQEISYVARQYGAKVVMRPPELATDTSRDGELLMHLFESDLTDWADKDLIVFLRPTHPIRNPIVIDNAIVYYEGASNFDSLRSMKVSSEIPFKMFRIDDDGCAVTITDNSELKVIDPINAPRQTLPKTYCGDAYVDVFPISTVRTFWNTTGEKILPFLIEEYSTDIDTFLDLADVQNFLEKDHLPSWFSFPTLG